MEHPDLSGTERLRELYGRHVSAREAAGDTACVSPEAILAVVSREGSERERLATLEHVMSCAACHREYQWLTAVNESAAEAEGAGAARRTPWWRSAPLALAASLAVAVGTGLLVRSRAGGAGEELRGESGDIALVAPGATVPAGGGLTFAWRPAPGAAGYVLEVQRGDGAVAFADTTSDTFLVVSDPPRILPATEYRWWVRELTDGAEPRSSAFRTLRLPRR